MIFYIIFTKFITSWTYNFIRFNNIIIISSLFAYTNIISKSNTFNNEFFICNECKMNLCPLCKSAHDKSSFIINYNDKNYICNNITKHL